MCKKYIIIIIIFLLVIMFVTSSDKSSGLYVDNGFDQTILYRVTSGKQKREIEHNLLNILGLPKRPRRIARGALLIKRSAPKYLLNIYKNILSSENNKLFYNEYGDAEFNLTGYDINIISQSDLIMTFGAHNPHSGIASRTNRGKRIWFDVSEVPTGEHIISAELRLYQSLEEHSKRNKSYTVTLYRVARTKNGRRMKYYISSVNITTNKEKWITLNISETLEYWVKHPKENRGLFLAVHHANYSGHTLRPADIGIVGVSGIPDKQPFMVGFFQNSENQMKREFLRRQKRSQLKRPDVTIVDIQKNPYVNSNVYRKGDSCSMKTLYISFKDLQWQDWIIAPEGYDAYYCSGECNFPLNIHMNASNHAIVQTLIHLLKPKEIPKPCCAPTKLSSISVLYFLDDSNVVLKKYKNMVVNSCGCY